MSDAETNESSLKYYVYSVPSRLSSQGGKVYCARTKSTARYGDNDLIRDLAAKVNMPEATIRYIESMRKEAIEQALRQGKVVYVGGVANVVTVKGPFDTIDGEFDPDRNKLSVTGFTYGSRRSCLEGVVPENIEKGAEPRLSSIREEGCEEGTFCRAGRTVTITGSELLVDTTAADEGVRLVDTKLGNVIAVAAVESSGLATVYCRFAELPPPGRYTLVVATRAGLSREHKVAIASREITVKEV